MPDEILNETAQSQLKSIIERAERLGSERDEIAEHLKQVFLEAKSSGFDVPTLKKVIARRKKDRAKLQAEDAILDVYLVSLGEA